MAIALDNTSSSSGSTVTSLSWTHTINTVSNTVLFVTVQVFDDTSTAERTVSGITYNGVALTKIDRLDNGNVAAELWYLINPISGARTIAITCGGTNDFIAASGASFTGVDQATPIDISGTGSGFGLTASDAVTTVTDNAWVIDSIIKYNTTEAMTRGGSQTQIHNQAVGAGFGIVGGSSYYGPKTPVGSATMSWTWATTSRDWSMVVAGIRPSIGGGLGNIYPYLKVGNNMSRSERAT